MVVSIGKLSECTGVNIETVRYYERIGLLPRPARSRGGHRQYDPAAVRRLGFIRRCRDLGFSIDDIRELLKLVDAGVPTCADVKAIAESHLAGIRQRLADLRKMEAALVATVGQCSGDAVPDCPVIDVLAG